MTVQTGQAGPHEGGETWTWDQRQGDTTIFSYTGTPAEIDGLVATYRVAGYKLRRSRAPGQLDRLEVSADAALDGSSPAADAAVSVEWELDAGGIEISIYKRMVQRGVSITLANIIEQQVQKLARDEANLYSDSVVAVTAAATTDGFNSTTALEWMDLVLAGVTIHRISNAVVRLTLSAPNAWVSSASVNVGSLYTRAELLAEYTGVYATPTGISADMPSTGYYLKEPVKRRTMGSGKIQLVYEWTHADSFSPLQYDLVT